MSFNTIKTEVIARLGGRTDLDSRVITWINDAYYELALTPRYSFFELDTTSTITTESGTRDYSISSITNLWFILGIRDQTNERKVRKSHWTVFDAKTQPSATGQIPTHYSRFEKILTFDPTPGGVYTMLLRFRRRPNEMTVNTNHLLGREWDEPITVLSTIKGYEALEQPEKAASQRTLLEQILGLREEAESLEDMDADDVSVGVRLEEF